MTDKSRHLPLSEYFTILQLEFISYYVRGKIYPAKYNKKYIRYCENKKEKIEKIGLRNSLPSIFTSDKMKEKYLDKFFNDKGLPDFQYRDEYSKNLMGYYDKVYWFSKGTTIRFEFGGEATSSVVIVNHPDEEKVVVEIGVLDVDLKYSEISRVITDSLINF